MPAAQRSHAPTLPCALQSLYAAASALRRRPWLAAVPALLAAITAGAQAPAPQPPKIDTAVLVRAADIAYNRDLSRLQAAKTLSSDPAMLAHARRAVEPLVSYAPDLLPGAAYWSWTINVETRPEAIAYCMPGGKILVTSGLFERVKLTDDEFAAIVAHVIAHALIGRDANDAIAAYERARGKATPDPDTNRAALQLADAIGKLILADHYDAAAEKDADALALELMARSGINPAVAAGAWRKVEAAGGTAAPALAALHPIRPERLAAIEAQMPAMMPLYQKAFTSRPPPGPSPPMPRR